MSLTPAEIVRMKSDAELLDRAGAIARSIRSALLRHDLSAAQRMLSQLPESVLAAHAELAVDAALYAYITASPTTQPCSTCR